MPRRRSPPALDSERVRSMLSASRRARDPAAGAGAGGPPSGWVPEGSPADADTSWLDDGWPLEEGDDAAGVPPGGVPASAQSGRHRSGPRVLTVPTPFRGAQLRVPWRAVVGLAIALLVAGAFFAVRVVRAQQSAAPQVLPVGSGLVARATDSTAFPTTTVGVGAASAGTAAGAGSDVRGPPSAPGVPRQVVVDVVGQVAQPGVVSVAEGARVGDVLSAAGGALPGADVRRLNLARVVTDGEQLFVPRPGETPPDLLGGDGTGAGGLLASSGSSASASVVNLNTANLAALDQLPGVGPVLAQRILDWRTQHGRFSTVDELGEVSGIGDKLLAQIRPKVRL